MTECACKWNGVGTSNPELIDACDAHRAWRISATAEARRKAIEECAAIAEACDMRLLEYPNDTARTHYESAVMDASMSIATIIRTLLSESKSC